MERSRSPSRTAHDEKGDDHNYGIYVTGKANFADLVFARERIESGLRTGKFEYASNNNRRSPVVSARKREGDAHAVTTAPTWMKPPQNIQSSYQPNPPNFLIRAENSLPTQVKGPPAADRASAQRTTPAAPRPINNTAPGASYKYAQHPPPKDNFPLFPWHTPSYGLHYW